MHPGYAPAIHTHGGYTSGANLVSVAGAFYNVDYAFRNGVLEHKGIQLISQREVAFVPGLGIHRVVHPGTQFPRCASVNVYWSKKRKKAHREKVGTDSYVYDFALKNSRVTTSGPAFFFATGEDYRDGFQATPLVQLEDIVYQLHQLRTAHHFGVMPESRMHTLNVLEAFTNAEKFFDLRDRAASGARSFIASLSGHSMEVSRRYFATLLMRAGLENYRL